MPFENTSIFSLALVRIYWFRHGIKKVKICRLASTDEAKQVIDIFDQMCDTISDTVESVPEYDVVMALTKFIVELKRAEGEISSQVSIALGEQISKIASNKKRLINHFLMHVRNLGKRTTGSNEVIHRKFKKGEDRVKPNSSLASAARTLTMKGKDEGLKKRKKAAKKVLSTALWYLHSFDATPVADCIIHGEKMISDKYDYVHMDDKTWYVCRQDDFLNVGSYTSKTCVLI